jgi:pimeloyl-ACP methyl ester carboxylesterase
VHQASELGPQTTEVVVTLVHGTWAHGAAWTQPDSAFCTQLREELQVYGAASVTFSRFDWSGGNTHFDRRLASIQLRKHLLDLLGTEPDARHYVVAHSHGGNVALRALRSSPALCRKVSGIAALATPFLTFRQQSFRLALLRPALQGAITAVKDVLVWLMASHVRNFLIISFGGPWFLVPVAVAIGLVWLAFRYLVPHLVHWLGSSWAGPIVISGYQVFAALVGAGLGVLALKWSWDEATEQHTKKLQSESRRVFLRYSYYQPESSLTDVPVFALSSFPDEAYGALAGSWWIHRATGWGVRFGIFAALLTTIVVTAAVAYEVSRVRFAVMSYLGWSTLVKTASPILLGGASCWQSGSHPR